MNLQVKIHAVQMHYLKDKIHRKYARMVYTLNNYQVLRLQHLESIIKEGWSTPNYFKFSTYPPYFSWFYRILPSVKHFPFVKSEVNQLFTNNWNDEEPTPNQLRWKPFDIEADHDVDFVKGIKPICGAGDARSRHGIAIYIFTCNKSMVDSAFFNSDGDFLIGKVFKL
jgi:hypothetical protein